MPYGDAMSSIDPDQRGLGLRLAEARLRAGVTQVGVAAWLTSHGVECSKQAVSAWEAGRNMPNPLVLRRLCRLYACSADSLLWELNDERPAAVLPPDLARRLAELPQTQLQGVLDVLRAALRQTEAAPAIAAAPTRAQATATAARLLNAGTPMWPAIHASPTFASPPAPAPAATPKRRGKVPRLP